MSVVQNILEPISEYLLSITLNTENGCYELEIGMPNNWVFKENEEINCTIVSENENGKLIKISPKYMDITIDDLIKFVLVIIKTNKRIKDEELEFQKRVEDYKEKLANEAKLHFNKIDELKDTSFKNLDGALSNLSNTNITDIMITDDKPIERIKPKRTNKPRAKFPTTTPDSIEIEK